MPRSSSPSRKPRAASRIPHLLLAGAGALLLVQWLTAPSGGKDWRGGKGSVTLKPYLVYEITLLAPYSEGGLSDTAQAALRTQLESQGARNVTFLFTHTGVEVKLEQSFQEPTTITFGKGSIGGAIPVSARRVDGLEWNAA